MKHPAKKAGTVGATQMINKNLAGYSYQPEHPEKEAVKAPVRPLKQRNWKKNAVSAVLGLIILVLILAITWVLWVGVAISKNSQKIFGSGNVFSLLSTSQLKNQAGRVNILMAGYSVDDPGHPGASLTDSIMLISLNTTNHTGYMLSIPRDLYVDIPGYGYGKINEAYQDGNAEDFNEAGYPTGGMGLLEKVISNDLNVTINYYMLTNYAAFRYAVNAVSGITINIQSPDLRGLYDPNISPVDGGPLKLSNGAQTLNGQTALNLARARGDSPYSYGFPQSDFNRTEHQRQMIVALESKATQFSTVANPIKVGELLSAVGNNIKTDVRMNNVRQLYGAFHGIKTSNLKSVGLNSANGKDLLRGYTTYSGEAALVPAAGLNDYSQIQDYISQL